MAVNNLILTLAGLPMAELDEREIQTTQRAETKLVKVAQMRQVQRRAAIDVEKADYFQTYKRIRKLS